MILGATSSIAEYYARIRAKKGDNLYLVGRNAEKLKIIKKDLEIRGAFHVVIYLLDFNHTKQFARMAQHAWKKFKYFDIALIAYSSLTNQLKSEINIKYLASEFNNNAGTTIVLLSVLAQKFSLQRRGIIATIGSVAGDRGRASNYSYASAKSAIEVFVSGLRARYFKENVHFLLIKPGFVKTKMTTHLEFPSILSATPERVAQNINNAIIKNKHCIYTPWFWKYIMSFIKYIPEFVFKRINL